ncbi:hypothetical protein Y032_0008g355 [Ancylostoma ceylanicum]|uniref:Uncharacterized protein n=1 Tax=Ancylostoma ceylanicum TaxID=53326 RepID=A0A016VN06_9BILA|nr:hypothetical protein Y032_0008g355 [Ancylostoma ceylanicum]
MLIIIEPANTRLRNVCAKLGHPNRTFSNDLRPLKAHSIATTELGCKSAVVISGLNSGRQRESSGDLMQKWGRRSTTKCATTTKQLSKQN